MRLNLLFDHCRRQLSRVIFAGFCFLLPLACLAADSSIPGKAPLRLTLKVHPRRAVTATVDHSQPGSIKVHMLRTGASSSGPQPKVTDPVALTVAKTGGNIQLSWGGTGPFMISWSPSPLFQYPVLTLADEFPSTSTILTVDPSKALECYDVTDASTSVVSAAVEGMGYDPVPDPEIDSLGSNDLWWGDSVTVNGFYFDKIASENIMFFNHRPQKASFATPEPGSGKYATDATFVIPEDARSGPVTMQTHGGSIESNLFLSLVPRGIGPYGNIQNVSYAYASGTPEKDDLYVAEGTTIHDVDAFLHSPTDVPIVTGLSKPYLSRETSDGRILYVDGVLGHPEIMQITVSSGATAHYAYTTWGSFTRNIQPVGIAVSHDGNYAYVADGSAGKLVRIPVGNLTAITDNWGGFAWQFADPCAMDAIDGTYVFASDTREFVGYTYTSGNTALAFYTSPYVATSFEIDWDVSQGVNIWPIWNTIPTANSYNVNTITPSSNVWRVGGFVEGRGDGKLEVDPLLFNSFTVPDFPPANVILNNVAADSAGLGFAYPSPHQVADRVLEVPIQGHEYLNLYLELIDPPDLAAYAPIDLNSTTGWTATGASYPYRANDNKGVLDYGLMSTQNGTPTTGPLVVGPTDSSGNVIVYLKLPERYAGDNLQIAAHSCAFSGACLTNKITYLTYVHTGWKRVLVERDKMFRKGGLLWTDSPAISNQINVYGSSQVSNSDWIVVFDRLHPYESGGERAQVLSVSPPNGDGSLTLTLDRNLTNAYLASGPLPPAAGQKPDFANGESGGFGVVSSCDLDPNQINVSGSCFFDADMRGIQQTFDDAFVQFLAPRSGMGATPLVPGVVFDPAHGTAMARFSQVWFMNKNTHPPLLDFENDPHNYFHLTGVGLDVDGSNAGLTLPESDMTHVMVGVARDQCTLKAPLDPKCEDNYNSSTTLHELTHEFAVNVDPPCQQRHDPDPFNLAWCGATAGTCPNPDSNDERCLMSGATDNGQFDYDRDEVNRLECEDLGLPSYDCSNSDCGLGVRDQFDPQ